VRPARILAVVVSAALGVAGGVATALATDTGGKGLDPLNLGVTMVDQPCTGDFLLVTAVGATRNPLGPGVSGDPDHSHYLSIGDSCPTAWRPRGTVSDGYASYLGPYPDAGAACAARVRLRGAFVTELQANTSMSTQCLCFLDPTTLPELSPGQLVPTEDGVYVRMLEDLLTSMHLLRLDHHFTGRLDPLIVTAIKQVQKDTVLPQTGATDRTTWLSLRHQGCKELS
jgi:hypothetical protein